MADRLIVDIAADGVVAVSSWLEGELAPSLVGGRSVAAWPVGEAALELLRWYVEDYLRLPYGVWEDRGPEVADQVRGWGEALFDVLFGDGAVRDAYMRLSARGGARELIVRSDAPSVLRLPWELLWDPQSPEPVALQWTSVGRSLPAGHLPASHESSGERLRVLMVIARPSGLQDVGYRMIARPLLRRLEAVAGEIDLQVLRPPTFDAFSRSLEAAAAAGGPYQIVHFDGHGILGTPQPATYSPSDPVRFRIDGPQGHLLFERPTGGADPISAGTFAAALNDGLVPLVVLNACQSAALGDTTEAAIATRLLQAGVGSVVAMGYSVYVRAAAEFMAAFYQELFAGKGVAEAVTAGRRRLYERPHRPSPKGPLALQDWMVPVHYLRREISFPQLHRTPSIATSAGLSLDAALDRLAQPGADDPGASADPLAPVGEFVGRDSAFYQLEVAARRHGVVVVHGPGGTGKTELAKAFGRWWSATGGVDIAGGVIFHSFEPGIATFGADGVITTIGLQLYGADFARLDPNRRRDAVVDTLRRYRLLVIWDNFESVHTMADPTAGTPPLDEPQRDDLRRLLDDITATPGGSVVVITSRTSEDWLGDCHRLALGGLPPDEAAEYAEWLLADVPTAQQRRQQRAFGDLLVHLDGHPLAMRIMLPQLQHTEPDELVAALTGVTGQLPAGFEADAGRTESLGASVAYSVTHLPADAQQLLTAVALFHGTVDAAVLTLMAEQDDCPEPYHGTQTEQWTATLDAAANVGLLTPIGTGMYTIHPALPAYLAAAWRAQRPTGHDSQRTAARDALVTAHSTFGQWLRQQIAQGQAAAAFALIERQRRTMAVCLERALHHTRYQQALAIIQPLDDYFDGRGLTVEAAGWVDRCRVHLENADGTPPPLDTPAGDLWLFVVVAQANRQARARELGAAERNYGDIIDLLEQQPDTEPTRRHRAAIYHQLGNVSHDRGALDDAERWCQRALAIFKEVGDRPGMANSYHNLGMVTQDRGALDDAEHWYQRALAIFKELRDWPHMANSYHQLGRVAHDRGALDDAERWYQRSLKIKEQLGNRAGMPSSYHQLGTVALHRGALDDAERWYQRALAISEELGDRPGMASIYHQFGAVALDRGALDDAERWYQRALAIFKEVGDRPGMANSYHNLGMVAKDRGALDDAERWYQRALAIFKEVGDRPGMANSYHNLGTVALDRGALDDAERWYQRSLKIKEKLGNRAGIANSYHQLGRVAHDRGALEDAERWYQRSLKIKEELGNRAGIANNYHQLGRVAHDRGALEDAERWYQRALAIAEELGDRLNMAGSYHNLGRLAEARGDHATALRQMVRCVTLFDEFPHSATGPAPYQLARLSATLGIETAIEAWRDVTGTLPPAGIVEWIIDAIERTPKEGN